MRLKARIRAGLILSGILVSTAATLTTTFWDQIADATNTQVYEVEHDIIRETHIVATRGPITFSGTFPVSIVADFDGTGFLDSLRLYKGVDSNSDDHVAQGEWTLIATASLSESGGTTTATIATISLPATAHAYRLIVDCANDDENSYEQIGTKGFTYSDP